MTAQHPDTPAQPSKRATIIDVAARAGVSKSLVSLAFKDPQRVSDERLERIRTAATELNYSPSFVAQILTSRQSPFIGILVLDFQNPLFIEVADAVRRALAEHGEFGLLLNGSSTATSSEPYGTLDPQVLRMLHSLRPCALIVVGAAADQNALPQNQRPTAVIAVNDIAALGCIRAVEEAGLNVPGDVAVAGFDNILVAGIPRVSLTSVDPNKDELGRLAALAALAGAQGKVDETQYLLVEPRLVVRGSSTAH